MNIDLLSKMVKKQILDCDALVIPGLGTFIAEYMSASFSDKGYTINPPYRRISFRQNYERGVNIIEIYALSNQISQKQAEQIINKYVIELRDILEKEKSIIFPELGSLRATKENNFFFIPEADIDIYPEGFALESISLKSNNIEQNNDLLANVLEENILSQNTSNTENDKIEENLSQKEQVKERFKNWKLVVLSIAILIAFCLIFKAILFLLDKYYPKIIDSILYKKEELEILNYKFY